MASVATNIVPLGVEYNVTNFRITWDHPVISVDQGTSIKLCCRGVQIDAGINVTKYKPQPNRKYEVGLVQILDYSNQKALYKKPGHTPVVTRRFKIVSWDQRHLPVCDGDPGEKLFYDSTSRKTITGTGPLFGPTERPSHTGRE